VARTGRGYRTLSYHTLSLRLTSTKRGSDPAPPPDSSASSHAVAMECGSDGPAAMEGTGKVTGELMLLMLAWRR